MKEKQEPTDNCQSGELLGSVLSDQDISREIADRELVIRKDDSGVMIESGVWRG